MKGRKMSTTKEVREVYVCTDNLTLELLRQAWEREKTIADSALPDEKDKTLVDRALRFYIGHWMGK